MKPLTCFWMPLAMGGRGGERGNADRRVGDSRVARRAPTSRVPCLGFESADDSSRSHSMSSLFPLTAQLALTLLAPKHR